MRLKMRTLYLDCGMGIAGDMLLGALTELMPSPGQFMKRLNEIQIPQVEIKSEESIKCGIVGTHVRVTVNGCEEGNNFSWEHIHEQEHTHEHTHEHEHAHKHEHTHKHDPGEHHGPEGHHHASLHQISHIVSALQVPEEVKKDVMAVYRLIADAEGKVHGKEVTQIHFHEVGMMDAVADITGCVLAIHELKPARILASYVNTGYGQVKCAHGILPVPAPAAAHILTGIPCYGGHVEGELCTPTGAALLKHFVSKFSPMPPMSIEKIGYGMGNKDFEAANCVRAVLGETGESEDEVIELSCNIDDMTAEEMGYALDVFLKNGALEAYTIPAGMKKSRPGVLLSVMCREEKQEELVKLIFQHTSTIGIRQNRLNRIILQREETVLDSQYGKIRVKAAKGYGISKQKMEYEDLRKAAENTGLSIMEIRERLQKEMDSGK